MLLLEKKNISIVCMDIERFSLYKPRRGYTKAPMKNVPDKLSVVPELRDFQEHFMKNRPALRQKIAEDIENGRPLSRAELTHHLSNQEFFL